MFTIRVASENQNRQLVGSNGNKQGFIYGSIGAGSSINSMTMQTNPGDELINLQIGGYCSLSHNIMCLFNRDHDFETVSNTVCPQRQKHDRKGQILIGSDVWIGTNVIILPGKKIGNGAVIGAGAVVSRDIPPYAVAAGNPVRVIKYRFSRDRISALMKIKWWNWSPDLIDERREAFYDIDTFLETFQVENKKMPTLGLGKKSTAFLFYPDFEDPYPVWPKVIREYTAAFRSTDETTLILRIPAGPASDTGIALIHSFLEDKGDFPDVLIFMDPLEDERSLFVKADYYITSRLLHTPAHIEWAEECRVKILSGVDRPVFTPSAVGKEKECVRSTELTRDHQEECQS